MRRPSHLSIELDHFYPTDLEQGVDYLEWRFQQVAPLVGNTIETFGRIPDLRVSTAIMVDDYNKLRDSTPQEVIGDLILPAAAAARLRVDYIGREAGCASLAEEFMDMITDAPSNQFGQRPPAKESGWLCRGQPPRNFSLPAMEAPEPEFNSQQHRIFMDTQVFSHDGPGRKTWACPYLASVWQALRLGVLLDPGNTATMPQPMATDQTFGDHWDTLPVVMQLNDNAHPFEAYRTHSILPPRYLDVEVAVSAILEQTTLDNTAAGQHMRALATQEGIALPPLSRRLGYAMLNFGQQVTYS